jgi:hypothetical protein
MSIDERGHAAATEIRRATASGVDTATMLEALHRRRRTRVVVSVVAAVAACAAVVAAVLVAHNQTSKQGLQPATQQSTHQATPPGKPCGASVVCLGAHHFVIDLRVPVTITLPGNFKRQVVVTGPHSFDVYFNGTGVSVLEDAVPVRYDGSWTRDPAAGRTAESVAHWLATRPFLTNTDVHRVSVGRLVGWHVTGELRRGAVLPASKIIGPVAPAFAVDGGTTGYRPGLIGDYTLVNVPGAGVTAIWSWSADGKSPIPDNRAFIEGLSFG